MNKLIVASLAVVVALIVSLLAREAMAQTKVKYAIMPSEGFYLQHGETHPLAPSLTQGLVVSHRWERLGWFEEFDVITPFSAANPALQLQSGPTYYFSDKTYLTPFVLGRYTPPQKGGIDHSLMVGGGLVVGIVINKETALGTGVAVSKVVEGQDADQGKWCFVIGPKLSFTLF